MLELDYCYSDSKIFGDIGFRKWANTIKPEISVNLSLERSKVKHRLNHSREIKGAFIQNVHRCNVLKMS